MLDLNNNYRDNNIIISECEDLLKNTNCLTFCARFLVYVHDFLRFTTVTAFRSLNICHQP